MEAVLRKVSAGFDDFVTEKYQDQIEAIFKEWTSQLLQCPQDTAALGKVMSAGFLGSSLKAGRLRAVNDASPLKCGWSIPARTYPRERSISRRIAFLLATFSKLTTADFLIVSIHSQSLPSFPCGESASLVMIIRFELVGAGAGFHREQRVGTGSSVGEASPPMRCGSGNGGLLTRNAVAL